MLLRNVVKRMFYPKEAAHTLGSCCTLDTNSYITLYSDIQQKQFIFFTSVNGVTLALVEHTGLGRGSNMLLNC